MYFTFTYIIINVIPNTKLYRTSEDVQILQLKILEENKSMYNHNYYYYYYEQVSIHISHKLI